MQTLTWNTMTKKAETQLLQVQGQPGQQSKTVSNKTQTNNESLMSVTFYY